MGKARYCPAVEDATFLAIVSDYDLSTDSGLAGACQTLDSISGSAEVEESTGFDPSGSSGAVATGNEEGQDEGASSSERRSPSETDYTSLTQSVHALSLNGLDDETATQSTDSLEREAQTDEHIARLQPLDPEAKEQILEEAFPGLKEYDIKWTLKKYNGDIELAMDDLLNQTFLEETGGRRRGVEGFSEGGGTSTSQSKKRKKNKKNRFQAAGESNSGQSSPPIPSAWEARRKGVEIISRLCGIEPPQASALYEQCKGHIPAALNRILVEYADVPMDCTQEALEELTILTDNFPSIELEKLATILLICENADSSPAEFCNALLPPKMSAEPSPPPSIRLDYKLKSKDSDAWSEVSSKPRSSASRIPTSTLSYAEAGQEYRSLRNENFNKASAAYRKARSDPLMGGAAAFYAQEGRDYNVKAKSAMSATADCLVAQQSSSKQLDLHGIGVVDAVRIAREAVTAWWHRVDKTGSHAGFQIITGKGTHSEDGVARIRNAVGRMLIREGWKVDIGSGSILVRGTTGIKKAYK